MIDPIPPPSLTLINLTQPLASALHLTTLPLHAHEILGAFLLYLSLYLFAAPSLSTLAFPAIYPRLPAKTRIDWNIRVVSSIQSTFISLLTLWLLRADHERRHMGWEERIWGYTGAGGMAQACATGYFLWDLWVSVVHVDVLGRGSLAHACSALVIIGIGFRPFANYYGLAFVLYELSTPLLNLHWFLDKVHMTGSRLQLYNGIALVAVFFLCRVAWGSYQSVRIYHDMWKALQNPVPKDLGGGNAHSASSVIVLYPRFEDTSPSEERTLPLWLVFTYLGSNTVLVVLNYYWFGKMIGSVRKRFVNTKISSKEKGSLKPGESARCRKRLERDLRIADICRKPEMQETPVGI
ncbi:hypothetical protein MMC13_002477 [Lambiella insularis]|nr:hypothetical protein [Lambiella insularis]